VWVKSVTPVAKYSDPKHRTNVVTPEFQANVDSWQSRPEMNTRTVEPKTTQNPKHKKQDDSRVDTLTVALSFEFRTGHAHIMSVHVVHIANIMCISM